MPKEAETPTMRPPPTRLSWESMSLSGVDTLKVVSASTPALASDEVLVGVRAIGLNYADVFCCLGLYAAANAVLQERGGGSFCPGLEFAGDVLAVGSEAREYASGDRVYGFSRFGAYRTVISCREPLLRKIPDTWSYSQVECGCLRIWQLFGIDCGRCTWMSAAINLHQPASLFDHGWAAYSRWSCAQAAALLVQGLTAWHALVVLGAARRGSRVLVHSAAGGVGCAALQICGALGCKAVGVIGSEAKRPFLVERFPSVKPLVRGPERSFAAQLSEHGSFDVVLESLGGQVETT